LEGKPEELALVMKKRLARKHPPPATIALPNVQVTSEVVPSNPLCSFRRAK